MTTSTFEHMAPPQGDRLRLGAAFWVALGLVFAVSLPNLADPFVAHDDFPALFLDPSLYWEKTLTEGRWLNYLWHLRGIETPAWLNFALYQALWAVFAASLANLALPGERQTILRALLAALIVLAPSAMLISFWFNTLLPGLALLALYGVVLCNTSERRARMLLPVFVIATFHAYPTYPLLLLALCLARAEHHGWRDLLGLLTLFAASFVAAMISSHGLNWYYHGVFDVPLAPWREATPAKDFAGLLQNLPRVSESFSQFALKSSLGSPFFVLLNGATFAASALYLARHAPWRFAYLAAGLCTGAGLVALQSLKLGVVVPPRACLFIWVFYVLMVASAAQVLRDKAPSRFLTVGALLVGLVASYALEATLRYAAHRDWQAMTRAVSAAIAEVPGPILVFGSPMTTEAGRGASVQHDLALVFRARHLVDRDVFLCDLQMEHCAGREPAQKTRDAANPWGIEINPDGTRLIFSSATP